jgi:L-alanine-DL-glutamate epimerase-like enolase superfamily enzyme
VKVAGANIDVYETSLGASIAGVPSTGGAIQFVELEILTDEGVSGFSYGWALDRSVAGLIAAAARAAATIVCHDDATLIGAAWQKMQRRLAFVGGRGAGRIGLSLVDMALWDIKCKSLDRPLWRVLGGHKTRAPMYSSALIAADIDGRSDVGAIKECAAELAELGFRHLKMRFGLRSPDVDAQRLADVAAAVGEIQRWAVDSANRWDVHESIRAADLLRDAALMWFEDPGPRDDYAALRKIARSTAIPICTGEHLYEPAEATAMVVAGCRYVSLDLQRCGGITGWNAIAALADASGVLVTPHIYGSVGAQLVCGTSNCPIGEHHPWLEDALVEKLVPEDGLVSPYARPGIGARLDRDRIGPALERITVR